MDTLTRILHDLAVKTNLVRLDIWSLCHYENLADYIFGKTPVHVFLKRVCVWYRKSPSPQKKANSIVWCLKLKFEQLSDLNWTASSEFGTYRLCVQRRFRPACASAQSRQNLRCSLIQAVNQEEPSNRKPDPWRLWMAGHAQLKFDITECSKTQIRLTGPNCGILRPLF